VLPPDPTAEQVREYVGAILDLVKGRSSFSSDDPEIEKLTAVGPEYVFLLIDFLTERPHGNHLRWALSRVVTERHRDLVIERLAGCPALAELVKEKGWGEAARETLIGGLEKVVARSGGFGIYVPTEWIDLVAGFRDPETYPALRSYLIRGTNFRWTWKAVRGLPGFDVVEAVRAAWDHEVAKRRPRRLADIANVAVKYGLKDALDWFVESREIGEEALGYVEYEGPEARFLEWYAEHRERIVWDPDRMKFRVKGE
jgi:hypothetical protein